MYWKRRNLLNSYLCSAKHPPAHDCTARGLPCPRPQRQGAGADGVDTGPDVPARPARPVPSSHSPSRFHGTEVTASLLSAENRSDISVLLTSNQRASWIQDCLTTFKNALSMPQLKNAAPGCIVTHHINLGQSVKSKQIKPSILSVLVPSIL